MESQDLGQDGDNGKVPEPMPPEGSEGEPESGSAMRPYWIEPRAASPDLPPAGAVPDPQEEPEPKPAPPKSDRQLFYETKFNELDRDLTPEERQEWNSIYASYRGGSALTGIIIGVDPLHVSVRNKETGGSAWLSAMGTTSI